jgi:hypothetical protein
MKIGQVAVWIASILRTTKGECFWKIVDRSTNIDVKNIRCHSNLLGELWSGTWAVLAPFTSAANTFGAHLRK